MKESIQTDLDLSPDRIFLWLAIGAGAMIAGGLISNLATFFLQEPSRGIVILLKAFNLDNELNVPTWYAAFLLAVNGGLLGLFGADTRRRGLPDGRLWVVLGAIFLLLSLDEIATIHEHLGLLVSFALGQEDGRFAWVAIAVPLVALVGLGYLAALARLPRKSARLMFVAGALYVGGAVGAEAVAWAYQSYMPGWSPGYMTLTWAEEAAEFSGQLLFSRAMLDLLAMRGAGFRFTG